MELPDLPEHARRNQAEWERWSEEFLEPGRRNWAAAEPDWGMWGVPERELQVLPDVAGKDVLELGCGTAYWSAWLARRGARVVGLDLTEKQLEAARRFQQEFNLEFPLIHANAEDVPLPDRTFDLVLSEYGASIWCDPYRWVPEAARLLRPGGELIFLVHGTLLMLCMFETDAEGAAENRLLRDYFGMHRFEWPEESSVEFGIGYGDWIRLLRSNGFEVTDLIEVRPSEDATTRYPFVSLEWATRWPSEEVWKARKR
jgi:SAM-dependent methyltransferase